MGSKKGKFFILIRFILSFILIFLIYNNISASPLFPSDIIKKCQVILKNEGWITSRAKIKNKITAHKYGLTLQTLDLKITFLKSKKTLKYQLDLIKNGKNLKKIFNFKSKQTKMEIEKVLLSYLLSVLDKPHPKENKPNPFSFYTSIGFNKTSSTNNLPKINYRDNLFLSWGLIYNPAKFCQKKKIDLYIADYLFFDSYAVFELDQEKKLKHDIKENYFNINFIISGTQTKISQNDKSFRRTGLYTGMEYFRPGFNDNVLLWTHDIYQNQPHVQYYLYRVLSWEYDLFDSFASTSYSYHFGAGIGPAMSSSLFAVNFSPEDEKNRSDIFKSLDSQKQNYYYSLAFPVKFSAELDNFYRSRISGSYDFYYFYALDPTADDEGYDFLQIFKGEIGFYLWDGLLLNSRYEFWQVNSWLNEESKSHNWKRLILELKYYI